MTGRDFAITDDTLMAFADGRLEGAERAAVESLLASQPEKAAMVAHWQRQNEALGALFPPVGDAAPARLNPHRIAAGITRQRAGWSRLAAAAVVLVALGGTLGWYGRAVVLPPESQAELLIDNAVGAHALFVREKRHAVEVAGTDKDHLVTWLSSRIETPIDTPDLGAEGFSLVGGRLLPAGANLTTGPAAQLMYENANSERVTVYVTAALKVPGPGYEYAGRNGLEAFYWANNRITCTVVGDLPEARMKMVAKKVYEQLSWRPDPRRIGG